MMKLKLQQFAAPGSTNPLRTETFENLQLNAGIFIKNLKYNESGSAVTDADALKTLLTGIINGTVTGKGEILGATRGGGTFNVTRDIRTPEVDGLRYKFKKGDFIDSVDAYLTTTLIEITPEVLAAALGVTYTHIGKVSTIKLPTALTDDSYLENICWIGDISDGRLVLICLDNAINTADLTLTFADKNEGTLGVEFHACQSQVTDYDYAPFEIKYFEPAA